MTDAALTKSRRKVVLFFSSVIILLAVVVTTRDLWLRWGIIHYLEGLGVDAQVDGLHVSLTDSRLTLEHFKLQGKSKKRLELNGLEVDWQWKGLLDHRLNVDGVTVEGLMLDVAQQGGKLDWVGPIDMRLLASDEPNDARKPSDWQVAVGPLLLQDFDVCLQQSAKSQCIRWSQLKLDSRLSIGGPSALTFTGDVVLVDLDVQNVVNLASAQLLEVEFTGSTVQWQSVALRQLSHQADAILGQSRLENADIGQTHYDLSEGSGTVDSLKLAGIGASYDTYVANIKELDLGEVALKNKANLSIGQLSVKGVDALQHDMPLAALSALSTENVRLAGKGSRLQLSGLSATSLDVWTKSSRNANDKLIHLDRVNLDSFDGTNDKQRLSGLTLDGIGALEDFADSRAMLVNIENVSIENVAHAEQTVIGKVGLTGLKAKLEQRPDSGLNLTGWLAPVEKDKTATQVQPAKPSTTNFTLEGLSVAGDSNIEMTDYSLGKPSHFKLSDIQLNLGKLCNLADCQPSELSLAASLGQTGRLSGKGTLGLSTPQPALDFAGSIKQLALPVYSPYSARFIGYRIDQGRLNVDFKVVVADQQIDSDFNLKLDKFELGALQQHEKSPVNQELGVPLTTALDLLRDSDDSIELSIPVKGDLSAPDFSVSGVVSKVTMKALKSAILYTYSPLGILSVAGSIVDLATALKFEPVMFAPGEVTLDEKARVRLDKAGTLLKHKTKVSLVLCANATQLDLPADTLYSDEQLAGLLAKANQRQQAVQQYLVTQHGISAQRLLLCNVKLDEKPDAEAKVDLSI